jgi:hypothetical protein
MEGIRRLHVVATRLMYGAVIGAAFWFLWFITRGSFGLGELIILAGAPALMGGLLHITAWVVEGFLTHNG